MNKLLYILLTCFCLCLLLQSTADAQINLNKKDRKKKPSSSTSSISKGLQDLTTRYNRYFNSKLLFEDGLTNLVQNKEEDYEEVLSVYPYKPGPDASTLHPNMDQIVEKTSYAVTYKPNSKWVDDCYLMMGKAYFMKGEYQSAIKSFRYINANFKSKKRKSGKVATSKSSAKKKKGKSPQSKASKSSAQQKNKEKAIAAKEREKERAVKAKERAKTKKAKEKERKKKAKERKKQIKQKKKRAEANRKARKKGKPIPYPKKDTVKEELVEEKEEVEEEVVEEIKEEVAEETEEVQEEIVEEETEEEDIDDIKVDRNYRDGGFLKHKLAAPEANIWLARSYIEDGQYPKAKAIIDKAKNSRKFPKRLQGQLNALAAHYYLEKEDIAEAKTSLKYAIKTTRKKKQRARYYYILGQLQERDNDHGDAVKSYAGVIKSKPSFDMELNARIQIARSKMISGEYTADRAISYLKKLTKDDKYIDQKDKLYHVMGEIALASGDSEQGLAYLKQSASSSTTNDNQKALSYLSIAELLYGQEDYLMASAYYDSTLTYLPKSYEDYDDVVDRKSLLEKLALNYAVIQREDSLLRIAGMSEAKRRVFLEEVIEQLQQEAEQKSQDMALQQNDPNANNNNNQSGGVWYFYNTASKAKGYNDFINQWGKRKNIDNWRTEVDDFTASTPGVDGSTLAESQADQDEIDELARLGNLTVEALEAKIPLSSAAKEASNERIALAHFEMGNIYGNRLDNREKAIYYFDRLMERYPQSPYAPQTHYNLYLLHQNQEPAVADQHKRVILDQYGNSVYAKMIRGEATEDQEQDYELEAFYTQTYAFYQKENYDEVLKRRSDANSRFNNNYLEPKFDMLEAYIIGKTKDRDSYITALNGIVTKYPDDEVKVKAEEILGYLGAGKPNEDKKSKSKYKHKPNSKHYFIIAMDGFSTQISSVQNELSNLNQSDFSLDKLKVNQMLLDKDNQIVIVKDFIDGEKAMIYYRKVAAAKDAILKDMDVTYQYFVISKLNFSQFFKEKDADSYYDFFIENYDL